MKRFRFRLDTILDLRIRDEEKIEMELAAKNQKIIDAQKVLNTIHEELVNSQKIEKIKRTETLSPILLRYSIVYRHKLKQDLLTAGRNVDDLKADAFKTQKELIEATKKRRAVEIVKERRLEEWKKELQVREQNTIDDIAQQKFIRNNERAL
jgi:flagellar protein FliJ